MKNSVYQKKKKNEKMKMERNCHKRKKVRENPKTVDNNCKVIVENSKLSPKQRESCDGKML